MDEATLGSSARTRATVPRDKIVAWAMENIVTISDYYDVEELAEITVC